MGASITLAGESLIAQKHAAQLGLKVTRFIFANVPGLDPSAPVDRAAPKPPAGQIVYSYDIPDGNAGYVNPNQVVYSAQIGSDIGDWDFNWIGLESAEGVLFAVAYVPMQVKRKNTPPLQIGNNLTRNFLVVFDGAQALTGISIDANTWQHDFTVRLAGIDERERLSNRDIYGRACFFGSSLQLEKVGSAYRLKPGTAYIEGVLVTLKDMYPIAGGVPVGKVWLDVCLERQLSDRVASWKVAFGAQADYTDSAGARHYCVPIAEVTSTTKFPDLRVVQPIEGSLVEHFAAQNGDYEGLRARSTTKADVGLGNLPNAKSDDPETNSSEILATTAALKTLKQAVGDSMTGMIGMFAMERPPAGWIKCNFAAVSRTVYAKLFAEIGTTYGPGDGVSTFNVPEGRGLTPRFWDDGRGVDVGRLLGSYQDMMVQSHAHGASAAAVGDHVHSAWTDSQGNHQHSAWTDAQGEHTHTTWRGRAKANTSFEGGGGDNMTFDGTTAAAGNHAHNVGIGAAGAHGHVVGIGGAGNHSHTITVAAAGGIETRAKNIAFLCCIKY